MNERALPVLEQYDLKIKGTRRIRGSYYCDTDRGLMLFKEYENSKRKLEIVEKLQKHLEEWGIPTDKVIRNREGELMSQGPDGAFYILKKWYEYRENELENDDDIIKGAAALAALHIHTKDMQSVFSDEDVIPEGKNLAETLSKHNKELLKVKRYMEKLKGKSDFEFQLKKEMDFYYRQAVEAELSLDCEAYNRLVCECNELKTICHGNSQHHNIIMVNDDAVIVNFIRVNINLQINDLYIYLKKCMEKNGWDIEMAKRILDKYQKVRSLNSEEFDVLKVMLRYPERFWKIVNNYYNSNKAWPSEKNREKLRELKEQEIMRNHFVDKLSVVNS